MSAHGGKIKRWEGEIRIGKRGTMEEAGGSWQVGDASDASDGPTRIPKWTETRQTRHQ